MTNPISQFHAVKQWTDEVQGEMNDSARLKDSSYVSYSSRMSIRSLKKTGWVLLVVALVAAAIVCALMLLLMGGYATDLLATVVVCLLCLFTIVAITAAFGDICAWFYLLFRVIERSREARKAQADSSREV